MKAYLLGVFFNKIIGGSYFEKNSNIVYWEGLHILNGVICINNSITPFKKFIKILSQESITFSEI